MREATNKGPVVHVPHGRNVDAGIERLLGWDVGPGHEGGTVEFLLTPNTGSRYATRPPSASMYNSTSSKLRCSGCTVVCDVGLLLDRVPLEAPSVFFSSPGCFVLYIPAPRGQAPTR